MKSPTHQSLAALRLLARDYLLAPETAADAQILRFVIAELERARSYLLPLGGEVDRNGLLAAPLDMAQLRFDRTSFALHFSVTDQGYDPTLGHVGHTTTRLALIQDLSEPRLHRAWTQLLVNTDWEVFPDSLLILPINRIHHPGIPLGEPGNRGWTMTWAAAHLRRHGVSGRYETINSPAGPLLATTLPIHPIPLGHLGQQMYAAFSLDGALDNEFARETMLETTAALDFGLALSNKTANLRRSPTVEGDTWLAGKGPRAAPKAH